eukprot:15197749-Alexandrium_andersonii.AAC.1
MCSSPLVAPGTGMSTASVETPRLPPLFPSGPRASGGRSGVVGEIVRGRAVASGSSPTPKRGTPVAASARAS